MGVALYGAYAVDVTLRRVALSCGPVRALLRTHGLESILSCNAAPTGAPPWEHSRGRSTRCAPRID